jgi:AAT family amino acid transporter/GABA permease
MIALGGIIGAGLFVGSSSAIASTGPAATISYALAGGIVFLIMRMLGEMAITLPEVNAFTEYTRIALGDWAGFSTGWLYWYFWVVVVAVEAIAGATILARWVALPVWLMALGMLTAMMLVNVMPVRSYGEFEYWFSSLKVAAILVFIAIAGGYALGINQAHASTLENLTSGGGFMPFGFLSILGAVPVVIFSIAGAEVATIAAAESAEPAKNIASITRSIVIRVLTFYVFSIFLIVAVVPWNRIVVGDSPFVAALEQMRISGAANIMNGLVLVAVLSCLNSGLYVSSRVLFELAKRGDAPVKLLSLNQRNVPLLTVVMSSAFGFLAIFTAVRAPAGVFRFLIDASGCIMLFVYLLIAIAEVKLRRSISSDRAKTITLKMWLFPWLSYAVIASIGAILLAMAWNRSSRPQVLSSTIAAGVTLGFFLLLRRRRKRRQRRKLLLKPTEILQE